MAEKKQDRRGRDSINRGGRRDSQEESIGNQQGTTQTGGQNSGGRQRRENIDDKFTDDLRESGHRKSRGEEGNR